MHRGKLEDAIGKVKPDIVHTHWTKSAIKYRDAARRMRKPMTARGHWHFIPDQLVKLEQDATIVRLYMFPHLAKRYGSIASKIARCTRVSTRNGSHPKSRRTVG